MDELKPQRRHESVISRRELLQGLVFPAVYLGGAFVWRKWAPIMNMLKEPEVLKDTEVNDILKEIEDSTGVVVHFGDSFSLNTSGDNPAAIDFKQSLRVVLHTLSAYLHPETFFRDNNVTDIYITQELFSTRYPLIFPVYGVADKVEGVAEGKGGPISLESQLSHRALSLRRVLHHEIFHQIERRFFKTSDEEWRHIQEKCHCGVHPPLGKESSYRVGSVSEYGTTDLAEDRAEFASVIMTPELHILFLDRITREPEHTRTILLDKFNAIKRLYFRVSNGSMDESFWKRLTSQVTSKDIAAIPLQDLDRFDIFLEALSRAPRYEGGEYPYDIPFPHKRGD